MAKEVMRRTAADNVYLHKDFHGALSNGLTYLEELYGPDSVREFLRKFGNAYYAPLKERIKTEGLAPLKEHFERIYDIEGGQVEISFTGDELELRIPACPAVMHMREHGYCVDNLFYETSKTINEALVDGTPFEAELVEYDEQTGRSVQRFFRRPA